MSVLAGEGRGADGGRIREGVGVWLLMRKTFFFKRRLPGGISIHGHERTNRHTHAERE